MNYVAFASDYDGTLAHDGIVNTGAIEALERLRHSGRKLILVTGRELPDLQQVFPRLDLFDCAVVENGAVLYNPQTRQKRVLAQPPPKEFIDTLRAHGVRDFSCGDVIVATWRPSAQAALEAIQDLGLELQLIFNKDAVMILPSGTNKMTGLSAALEEMGISRHNVVGVGDAENDHAFLSCCEFSVAVANAIPALKDKADWVTEGARGDGVIELIEALLKDDLPSLDSHTSRRRIPLGTVDSRGISLPARGNIVLVCGHSGSGKSTLVTGLLETLIAEAYQVCLIDPEGDYEGLPGTIAIGYENRAPSLEQVSQLLDKPEAQLVVSLIGLKMGDRAKFFASLLTRLQDQRLKLGRPHWLVVDEAHHMLPCEWAPAAAEIAGDVSNAVLVTVHPEHVSPAALKLVKSVVVVGKAPHETIQAFAKAAETQAPDCPADDLAQGEALVWFRDSNEIVPKLQVAASRTERNRHKTQVRGRRVGAGARLLVPRPRR